MTSVHFFLLLSHLRFINTAEEYPDILADMTTSLAVQLMECSKGLRPSMPATQHSLALESCVPSQTSVLPPYHCNIVTPLKIQAWEWKLRAHPDQALVSHTLRGIRDSFRIGFHRSHTCKTAVSLRTPSSSGGVFGF